MNFWQKPVETLYELLQRKAPHLRQVRHFPSAALHREVDFDVYLPPDYHLSSGRKYPLVLFNDGQDLPHMDFASILERLYFEQSVPHFIAVGVHASGARMHEYGTARQPDYKHRGDKAPQYTYFIINELLPQLMRRFRISEEPKERVFAGFSLGGLSAIDIAWAHPQVFGASGVFSGALWWRWSPVHPENPDADRIMHDIIRQSTHWHENQRFWFQCGTLDEEDDRNNNGVIDSIDDTLDLIRELRSKGCPEHDVRYLEMQGGRHEPYTWGQAMPDFLRWTLIVSRES
ncbi:MAG: esterase family protein [Saprospiraceae bacterium]|nr:esterase family protein [Saprospiraceae bacterium]